MTSKTAVVVLSDPATGTDEALGRVFNALAAAWEFGQAGEALVLFQGAGTRWPAVLSDPTHPAHELWSAVRQQVAVVASAGCATVFGAATDPEIPQVGANLAPGTPGVAGLRELSLSGHQILVF